jgi:Carboxypeptidase regulatory-like domain
MKMRVKLAIFAFLLLAISSVMGFGQATTSLRGTVTDPSGAVVPGANVRLVGSATGGVRSTTTGANGSYEFNQIQPGSYSLTITAAGFQRYNLRQVQVFVNSPATVNAALRVGAQTQVVSVTSTATPLNTTDARLGTPFTTEQIVQLPIESRNVGELLSLQTGVTYLGDRSDIDLTDDSRAGAVNGVRSDQSNFTLDGIDVNDQNNGYAFTSVLRQTPDSLQEFNIVTTNFLANQGRSAGAQVTLVTKGGTNKFHGSLYEYLRNTATSANDYFIKLDELESGQPNVPAQLNYNIFGGSIGGPIIRNRLFFFTNLDFDKQVAQASVIQTVPSTLLRQGIVQYPTASGGVFAMSAQDLKLLDPLHIGADPAVLKYFNTYPEPNNDAVGDGYNWLGYGFPGHEITNYYTYIARFDALLNRSGTEQMFWRGDLDNDYQSGTPFLPGLPPYNPEADYNKGYALGLISSLGPNKVNTFTWGETRQSVDFQGDTDEPWTVIRGLSQNIYYGNGDIVPLYEARDQFSWIKGEHTIGIGGSFRLIHNNQNSLQNSFSYGEVNTEWLNPSGFANTTAPLNPVTAGFPAVNTDDNNVYDWATGAVLGMVTEGFGIYNYTTTGGVLPQGAPVLRYFDQREYEPYAQDSWKIRPNFTMTYGLRWDLQSPVWETHGYEVAPNVNMSQYFSEEASNAAKGIPEDAMPLISFDLAGPSYGKQGYYPWHYLDFAPRLAFAYSPRASGGWRSKIFGTGQKTAIRAGFGMAYDHFGEGLVDQFSQLGSFGLSTDISNAAGVLTDACAPRLTSMNVTPTESLCNSPLLIPAPKGGYPSTPPAGAFDGGLAIAQGVDNGLTTPYTYMLNFTIDREVSPSTTLSLSYVGSLSRHLLAQDDMTEPTNLVDKASGVSYFQAASRLAQLANAGVSPSEITPGMVGKTAAYWTDLFPSIAGMSIGNCASGCTALQEAYAEYQANAPNWSSALYDLDIPGITCANGCSALGPYSYFQPQYSSLYAWRSITNASYNAMEVTLNRRISQGVQYQFNYTYSRCIDIESDAERVPVWGGYDGEIVNAWDPGQLRGVCDYDITHQINSNFVAQLPFGRGEHFGHNLGGFWNALLGGWQLGGIIRWTTGLPFNIDDGAEYPTDWQLEGTATLAGSLPKTGTTYFGNGDVNVFPNPAAALSDFAYTNPGASGIRNVLRGDGYYGLDANLAKSWAMPWSENQKLQFRWEVFNVPNAVRFNVDSHLSEIDIGSSFGNYTGLLTNPRVMQFVLRYDF